MITAEADLLREADLVLFSSQGLLDRYRAVKQGLLVRNAVHALRQFQTAGAGSAAAACPRWPAMWVRWIPGLISKPSSNPPRSTRSAASSWPAAWNSNRFDASGRCPTWSLPERYPIAGSPSCWPEFRVALIPFRINPLTLMTNPIKMYEYFSCGLPVVSTPLPEVQAMGDLVYVGATPADFARQVSRALEEDDPSQRARRREIALRESWTAAGPGDQRRSVPCALQPRRNRAGPQGSCVSPQNRPFSGISPLSPDFALDWLRYVGIPSEARIAPLPCLKPKTVREIPYLSTGQVAEILGITKKTLKNWLKAQSHSRARAQSDEPVPALDAAGYRESIRRIVSDRNRDR